jgi:glycosyltransferase involved in cell wall biosynthesis
MRVLMLSKACVVGEYQRKLEAIAREPDVALTCLVPPYWQQGATRLALERAHLVGYDLAVLPVRFNGHFHFWHFAGLRRWLDRLAPDLVHVDEEPYNLATGLALRLAARRGVPRLFFTWQNLHRRYPPPFGWWERYALRATQHALAGSAEAASVLRHKGYRGPVSVIPQFGVDPDVFYPRERREGAAFVVGYAGRLVEEKGLPILLAAFAGLPTGCHLEIAGSGPLRAELARQAAALGVAARVRFLDQAPSGAMPTIVAGWDALALPSLTRANWKEQFGRILVEAMASGVPCVGSDSGEIPHVLGDAGLVVREGDADALGAALRRLLDDRELRRALAARGRARVLARYTHARIAAHTCAVYRRVAKQDATAPVGA